MSTFTEAKCGDCKFFTQFKTKGWGIHGLGDGECWMGFGPEHAINSQNSPYDNFVLDGRFDIAQSRLDQDDSCFTPKES